MENFNAADSEQKQQTRRGWRFIFALMGLLLVVLAVVVFTDDAPPDDAWMLPTFTPGGGERNPLAVLCEELEKLPEPDFAKLPAPVRLREKGQEPAMRAFVEQNAAVSRLLDDLLKTDSVAWRWPGGESQARVEAKVTYLSRCQSLANLQRMKIEVLARDGKADEAAAEALKVVRLGHGLGGAEGGLIHWLVAETIQAIGETGVKSALSVPGFGAEALSRMQEVITPLEPRIADLRFSLQADYLSRKRFIIEHTADEIGQSLGGWFLAHRVDPRLESFFFRKHRTLATELYFERPLMESTRQDWAAEWHGAQKQQQLLSEWGDDKLRFMINANVGGNDLVYSTLTSFSNLLKHGPSDTAKHRQTVLMLALRRYELAEGHLPDKLEALVPKYLPAVPLDTFDNAPMRWNPKTQIVYSIGSDLKDDGGDVGSPPKSTDKDTGDAYWWKPVQPKAGP